MMFSTWFSLRESIMMITNFKRSNYITVKVVNNEFAELMIISSAK